MQPGANRADLRVILRASATGAGEGVLASLFGDLLPHGLMVTRHALPEDGEGVFRQRRADRRVVQGRRDRVIVRRDRGRDARRHGGAAPSFVESPYHYLDV